jgi:hypothetical protein
MKQVDEEIAKPYNVKLLVSLADAMEEIRLARQYQEGAGVTRSRVFMEAIKQYVSARPQRELLQAWRDRFNRRKAKRSNAA